MFDIKSSARKNTRSAAYGGNQQDQLRGYEEVNREEWMDIEPRTYIKYEKDGTQRRGFVMSKNMETEMLFLQDDMYKAQPFKTSIGLKKIDRLWRKLPSGQANDAPSSNSANTSIARMIKALSDRLNAVEDLVTEGNNDSSDQLHSEFSALKIKVTNMENDMKKIRDFLQEVVEHINDETSGDSHNLESE